MQTRTLMAGGGAIVAVALGAAIYLRPIQDQIRAERAEVAVVQDTGATTPVVQAAPEAVDDAPVTDEQIVEDVTADAPVADVQAVEVPEPAAAPRRPEMTDRRFEGDGGLLVSGMAQPGMPVAVLVDGVEVERVDVGPDGGFVVVGFIGFSDAPRVMRIISDPDGTAIEAERTFILDANPMPVEVAAVATDDTQDVEVAATETSTDTAAVEAMESAPDETPQDQDTVVAEAIEPADTAQIAEVAGSAPASPAILAVTQDGVEVVQPPVAADTPPEVMSNVALDTITYDPEGEVILRGRATGAGFVQVYVDNAPVSRLPVDPDGTWRGDLPDVDTGVYTLRIDEVDEAGDVVSRIETPFLREDAQDVADTMADQVDNPDFTIATRTVQPGATLWAIAEERYGSGVLYVSVFEANRDRIRDPDLIYPGQVFVLPEGGN